MGDYQKLFDISVEHAFFSRGKCTCLDFMPSANTARIVTNAGLLIKKSGNGILVLCDRSRLEALSLYLENDSEELEFVFKIFAIDSDFKTYTEPFSEAGREVLYFENQSRTVSRNKVNRLHGSKYASGKNLLNLDSAQLKEVLGPKDRLIPPVSVVRINAKRRSSLFDERFVPKSPSFSINFDARQTYWKYYLHSKKAGTGAYVFDPDNRVAFESGDPVRLSDGRLMLTYRSKERIPLKENYDFKFQLKQPANRGEKIVYRQLPFARVGQSGIEVVAEKAIVVSEIYVNS